MVTGVTVPFLMVFRAIFFSLILYSVPFQMKLSYRRGFRGGGVSHFPPVGHRKTVLNFFFFFSEKKSQEIAV